MSANVVADDQSMDYLLLYVVYTVQGHNEFAKMIYNNLYGVQENLKDFELNLLWSQGLGFSGDSNLSGKLNNL